MAQSAAGADEVASQPKRVASVDGSIVTGSG
jgi:hypothetical protein